MYLQVLITFVDYAFIISLVHLEDLKHGQKYLQNNITTHSRNNDRSHTYLYCIWCRAYSISI